MSDIGDSDELVHGVVVGGGEVLLAQVAARAAPGVVGVVGEQAGGVVEVLLLLLRVELIAKALLRDSAVTMLILILPLVALVLAVVLLVQAM